MLQHVLDRVLSLDAFAIFLSLASLGVSVLSMRTARAAFSVTLRDQWIEKIRHELESRLPTNNICNAAGLCVARLVDSLPKQLVSQRREIVKHGFYRAIPGGGFEGFWNHLCKIQGWRDE